MKVNHALADRLRNGAEARAALAAKLLALRDDWSCQVCGQPATFLTHGLLPPAHGAGGFTTHIEGWVGSPLTSVAFRALCSPASACAAKVDLAADRLSMAYKGLANGSAVSLMCAACPSLTTAFRCSGCLTALYCCPEHQNLDWPWHKVICKRIRAAVDASVPGLTPYDKVQTVQVKAYIGNVLLNTVPVAMPVYRILGLLLARRGKGKPEGTLKGTGASDQSSRSDPDEGFTRWMVASPASYWKAEAHASVFSCPRHAECPAIASRVCAHVDVVSPGLPVSADSDSADAELTPEHPGVTGASVTVSLYHYLYCGADASGPCAEAAGEQRALQVAALQASCSVSGS